MILSAPRKLPEGLHPSPARSPCFEVFIVATKFGQGWELKTFEVEDDALWLWTRLVSVRTHACYFRVDRRGTPRGIQLLAPTHE